MTLRRATIAGVSVAAVLVLLALAASRFTPEEEADPTPATSPAILPPGAPAARSNDGFLYGRITLQGGTSYEGRLRFGGTEEAFWSDHFNGLKDENPWAAHVPPEQLTERQSLAIFGVEIAHWERPVELSRPFMVRFGDLERIEALGLDLRVTLKSGTVLDLDRFSADDFGDGVRMWHGRDVLDFGEWRIRMIELLPTPELDSAPDRLHGTVRTRQGDFTGFVQWNREESVGTDELNGQTADGEVALRFDTIRTIARSSSDSSLVTLVDGSQRVLSASREVGQGNRGVHVDDLRYGRVLISWPAFERVDFSPGGSGPAYGDFPPGRPLEGSVTTREGKKLAGRLVYDIDESETTDTLDAPAQGVYYTIPFGLIASIAPRSDEEGGAQRSRVTLHSGEVLELERAGDLGEGNAGSLIFVDGRERPYYVPWRDVERVDLGRPPAMYPPASAAAARAANRH